MRSLERSQFSDSRAAHFGLAWRSHHHYLPIRKFNDFFVHRIIKAKLHAAPHRAAARN